MKKSTNKKYKMRTTLNLDYDLHKALKIHSAKVCRPMSEVVTRLIERHLKLGKWSK